MNAGQNVPRRSKNDLNGKSLKLDTDEKLLPEQDQLLDGKLKIVAA